MKLISDDARYADGRKVCLGDVVEREKLVSCKTGIVSEAWSYGERAVGHTRVKLYGMVGVFYTDDLTLHRHATRREYFELVGMNAGDMPWSGWYHELSPEERYQIERLSAEDRMTAFDAWLDEPMFNEEGELL